MIVRFLVKPSFPLCADPSAGAGRPAGAGAGGLQRHAQRAATGTGPVPGTAAKRALVGGRDWGLPRLRPVARRAAAVPGHVRLGACPGRAHSAERHQRMRARWRLGGGRRSAFPFPQSVVWT